MSNAEMVNRMENSASRQVAKAAGLIVVISVAGKLIAFVREQVVAHYFGATQLSDAYFTAWAIPQMMVAVLGGALCTALLPVFMHYPPDDRQDGWRLVSVAFRWMAIVMSIASLACYLMAPRLIRLLVPNFDPGQQALTISLLRIMLYGVVLMGIINLMSTLLDAHRQFVWPALRPLALNLTTIIGTAIMARSLGISGLAWAKLLGIIAEVILLTWQIRVKRFPILHKGSYWHPGFRKLAGLALPILAGSILTDAYVFVDKALASGLDYGSIAALHYANGLMSLPLGIFVTAVSTAIYPTLAELSRNRDYTGTASSVGSGLRLLALIMLPAAVGMFVLRTPIVVLIFQRGSFDAVAASKTAFALAFYAPGILGLANQQILNRAFYALHDSLTPLKVRATTSLLHILLSVVLVGPLRHGGLALASSVSALCNMGVMMVLLRRRLSTPLNYGKSLVRIGIAALGMGLVTHFAYISLEPLAGVVAVGMAAILGATVYIVCMSVMGVEEFIQIKDVVRQQARRIVRLKEGGVT